MLKEDLKSTSASAIFFHLTSSSLRIECRINKKLLAVSALQLKTEMHKVYCFWTLIVLNSAE
jgi:hypothetical protein